MTRSLSPQSGGMKHLVRPTVVVTLFAIGGQAIGFVTQMVIAAAFGARADMDAFLAANTLPQYAIAVLLSALGFVFIPVFVDYSSSGDDREAWEVVNSFVTLCAVGLGVLALVGIVFARPLLRWTTPGLSPESLDLAARVAVFTWPTLVVTGLASLLTGIYQAQRRFGWSSAAPVIGALLNLGLVVALARPLGILGVAISATAGMTLQLILLAPIVLRSGRFRVSFNYRHPGVRHVLHLLWPLVLSGLLIRWTPIIDRYLASNLGEGAISHLSYAFKLLTLFTVLISTGITTVIFPRMALNTATGDLRGLGHTVSMGLRLMWLVTAPAITLGAALSVPLVSTVFLRGQFGRADAVRVAAFLQIYLWSLIAGTLGNITGRAFYALKETRIIAIMGVVEAVAYAVYAPRLVMWLGAAGIALAYVLYYNASLLWQLPVLRYKIGKAGGRTILISFLRTGLAAAIAGAAAWLITVFMPNSWVQLVLGGTIGLVIFLVIAWLLGSSEVRSIWLIVMRRKRMKPPQVLLSI